MYDSKHLTEELLGLERNNNGRIDHSERGINCLTGDTAVRLVDGRILTMQQLVKEYNEGIINYVYSFNEKLKIIEPQPIINAFKSGISKNLLKITLDNDKSILCTPEHRFMLRDGSYI